MQQAKQWYTIFIHLTIFLIYLIKYKQYDFYKVDKFSFSKI